MQLRKVERLALKQLDELLPAMLHMLRDRDNDYIQRHTVDALHLMMMAAGKKKKATFQVLLEVGERGRGRGAHTRPLPAAAAEREGEISL